MTNSQWQQYFEMLRNVIEPSSEKKMTGGKASMSMNGRRIDQYSEYHGETLYYYYVQTINNILKAIRNNESDYCYNLDQIKDLLRFEHDRLRSEWMPENGCFRVWLSETNR